MTVEANESYFLITDKKVSAVQEIIPLLQVAASLGKDTCDHCRGF